MKILMMTKWPWWLTVSLVLTAVTSVANIIPRYKAEQANRAVGIVIEGDVVAELAASQRMTFDEGLIRLKTAGANVLASNEQTVGELVSNGTLTIGPVLGDKISVFGSKPQVDRVLKFAATRLNPDPKFDGAFDSGNVNVLRGLPIGLPSRDIRAAKENSLPLLARLGNPNGATEEYIRTVFDDLHSTGVVQYYLPLGDMVLGSPGLLDVTQTHLDTNSINFVPLEFGKTVGESLLVTQDPENAIRLHAAQSAELIRMPMGAIVERYVKAARERNIRLLLIRPNVASSEHPLTDFADLIHSIKQGLEHDGLMVKAPRPYVEPDVSPVLRALLGLVLIPGLVFTLLRLGEMVSFKYPLGLVALGVAIGLMPNLGATREIATLASTVLLPILGYIWFFEKPNRNIWLSYLGMSAISIVGGLPVAGLLVGLKYMLHVDIFTGVKVAVFLPVFVAAWIIIQKLTDWKEAMKQPIVWGSALTSIVVLLGLGFMYMRTGNDNPAAVSGMELKLRDLLDQWLVVRPRTKEFMIGNPALFVGLAIWARTLDPKWRIVGGFLLIVGAIGQTSIVNTLCHLHTPIHLSLIRIAIGLLFGCILGALGWLIVRRYVPDSTREEKL
ncbi:MAG: DUF5693 family protein [Fimbriimonadaceae bacterium]